MTVPKSIASMVDITRYSRLVLQTTTVNNRNSKSSFLIILYSIITNGINIIYYTRIGGIIAVRQPPYLIGPYKK